MPNTPLYCCRKCGKPLLRVNEYRGEWSCGTLECAMAGIVVYLTLPIAASEKNRPVEHP